MSVKAEDLKIWAGDGVAYKLALFEVEASAEDEYIAVPALLDVPPPPWWFTSFEKAGNKLSDELSNVVDPGTCDDSSDPGAPLKRRHLGPKEQSFPEAIFATTDQASLQ